MDARITDLGLATNATLDSNKTELHTHAGGTAGYKAPEIFTSNRAMGENLKFSNKVTHS